MKRARYVAELPFFGASKEGLQKKRHRSIDRRMTLFNTVPIYFKYQRCHEITLKMCLNINPFRF